MMKKYKTIVIAAGGTGGHVFPALAVAQYLQQQGYSLVWLGTERGIESKVIPAANIPIQYMKVTGWRKKGWKKLLSAPWQLIQAVWQAMQTLRSVQAGLVLGMGGYTAGPAGLAAKCLRCPLIIHEQNAVAGLTNRVLAKLADRVLMAFPNALPDSPRTQMVANPLRADIVSLPTPEERFALRDETIRVLIIGGSQGAHALNTQLPAVLAKMSSPLSIWHQTGQADSEMTQQVYVALGKTEAKVTPFIQDMAEAYAWADLVICRAGALTVSELAAVGLPAVFIPFPQAVDDHQTKNALYLVDCGAAVLLPQAELSEQKLHDVVAPLLSRQRLLAMAQAAYAAGSRQATQQVAHICIKEIRS